MFQPQSDTTSILESVADLVTGDPDTGFKAALAQMGRFFQADTISLVKIGSVEDQYSIIAQWPEGELEGLSLNPWRHHSLLTGQTVVQSENCQDDQNDVSLKVDDPHDQAPHFIRIPIYQSGKVAYCLGLDWLDGGAEPNCADQLKILEPAARLIQSVLQSRHVSNILHTLSPFDQLTGLASRSVLLAHLDKGMARTRRNNGVAGIIHLNIDQLKTVNDTLGFLNGDHLLKAVAKRLVEMFRETDTVARIGNDNFVILLDNANSEDRLACSLQRIVTEFEAPIFIGGQNIHVQLSQGVAVYDGQAGETAENILRYAETAMRHAKGAGGNQVKLFTPKMNTARKKRLGLEYDIHRALHREEFEVHYQPKLSLKSGKVIGAEALIRWPHPKLGMLPPSEFLWMAEETGLIIPLSEWILNEACTAALHWHRNAVNGFHVAVNVSPRWFMHPGFPEAVKKSLDHTNLPPACLEFEITEEVVLTNTETTGPLLAHLKDLGVKITLDDFGTGYSSLSYLRNIPVNALKIDPSFVRNMETGSIDAAIVLALITLCNELKIEIVAEGVETPEQLAFLKSHGCHLAQGYHIGRPGSRDALNDKIEFVKGAPID